VHLKLETAILQAMLKRQPTDASGVPLDEQAREAIRDGLAQAERREFVPDHVVRESNERHGIHSSRP
jgi:hypothetical protein